MVFDLTFTKQITKELMAIDSMSGYCEEAIQWIEKTIEPWGHTSYRSAKGNLIISVEGKEKNTDFAIAAHVDTLGLMVTSIQANGRLSFTKIGGPLLPTLDGEYCKIITRDKKTYSGTILCKSSAAHVYKDAATLARTEETMEIVLDEMVTSKEEVEALGIQNGDYIAIDTKTTILDNGFIKSRFLDDKFSVAGILGLLHHYHTTKQQFQRSFYILISTYEEVGHGCSYIPSHIKEVLSVDMGCIGKDLSCCEQQVSICAKDSSGPYDYQMTTKLIELAKQHQLQYCVDVYPYYSSDVSAALKGGNDIRGALIGAGIFASHGMERGHFDGLKQTIALIEAYINRS